MSAVKACLRCHQTIICLANDIANCACSQIKLSELELKYIAKTYDDCLCNSCLMILKEEYLSNGIIAEDI